jgi:hypothetical protein
MHASLDPLARGRCSTRRARRVKQMLAGLMAVGGLSSLTVGGTFALFRSEESNAGSKVATGTLTLNDKVGEGATCYSYKGEAGKEPSKNSNEACQALFTSASLEYPGAAATAKLKITDDGSLDAKDLELYMPGCSAENTPLAPSPGAGNPCSTEGDEMYVQETNSSWEATECRYPAAAGACKWVANTLYIFAQNYKSTASALDFGSGPEHEKARYFEVALRIPAAASNELQGRQAAFGLTWYARA